MGSDACNLQKTPAHLRSMKVHHAMCTQLLNLTEKISTIFPEIEAARPGCLEGIQALCQLHKALDKVKEHVWSCCESSKLYLVITGEAVVSRFERARMLLLQSLSKLQSMVPVSLQFKISEVLDDLRAAEFFMDSNEELAGKALIALLQQSASPVDSVGSSEIELLKFAASLLHLSSQKDLVIERRSLKKMLDETKEGDLKKRRTLMYLLHILKKYYKHIIQGQARDLSIKDDEPCVSVKSDSRSVKTKSTDLRTRPGRTNPLDRLNPPEEFICHLSSELMDDPVVISSGQTFERAFIQKWFDEGGDTCPKTRIKLPDLRIMPNTQMRDLIMKWRMEHGINISELSFPSAENGSLETSFNSISSSASSMRGLHLQVDISDISLGSFDNSYSSFSQAELKDSFGSCREASDVESIIFRFYRSVDEIKLQFLSNISCLPWESQCSAVEDVNNYFIYYNPSCAFVSTENFLDPLIQFLRDALDKHDGEAQKVGTQLLLIFLRTSRTGAVDIKEDVYSLLASFLYTEAAAEALSIVEVLCAQVSVISEFSASGVLTSVIKLLDSHSREAQEAAIRILYKLSLKIDASSCKLASNWIPKLVTFLEDSSFAGTCVGILENLCKFEEARLAITETSSCIASIIELLDTSESKETQEHAVGILLRLCAQRTHCCHLVLHEGGIPALCHVSVNGSDNGKVFASEVLRLLRDYQSEAEEQCTKLDGDVAEVYPQYSEPKSRKTSSSFGWKNKIFSKRK